MAQFHFFLGSVFGTPSVEVAPAIRVGIYLDILQAGYEQIPAGGLVLAHNSVNNADKLSEYLAYVRDPTHFRASVNVILDGEGLEVSAR